MGKGKGDAEVGESRRWKAIYSDSTAKVRGSSQADGTNVADAK